MTSGWKTLVPTDFSTSSQVALKRACELLEHGGGELHLVHIVASGLTDDVRRERLDRLARLCEPYRELSLDVRWAVLPGQPHRSIIEYAEQHGVDSIVMGTHGRTGLARFALGSVADRVLRSAPCTVLVVRPTRQQAANSNKLAAQVLLAQFGADGAGDRAATLAKFAEHLCQVLELEQREAERMLMELQESNAIAWNDASSDAAAASPPSDQVSSWHIDPAAAETQDHFEMSPVDAESSAAVDLIRRALKLRATDVHFDPGPHQTVTVRMRIDGHLEEYCRLDRSIAEHLQQQLKLNANLDITEPFRPKEGRVQLSPWLNDTEVRITTCRVIGGEAISLRLFSRDAMFHPLSQLGLEAPSFEVVEEMLKACEGIVLVTGPTGAGKTTTVYSMLETLGGENRNIISIEDPVEFMAPYVRQMTVDERHGIDMTNGLRTLLRMDPDIVFVGEIRDSRAADIAMRAASSGRHVFSTLHTRDVASTVTALRDLRIDNRSLAGNLTGIINQRLLRRLCSHCRRGVEVSDEQRAVFQENNVPIPERIDTAPGCDQCRGTGYRGRVGVFETARATKELAQAISRGDSEEDVRQILRSSGTRSLLADALEKVRSGLTSFAEAIAIHWL